MIHLKNSGITEASANPCPQGVRDGTVSAAREAAKQATTRRDCLRDLANDLVDQIDAVAKAAKEGTTTSDLSALANRKKQIDHDLNVAESVLQEATDALAKAVDDEQSRRFSEAIAAGRETRLKLIAALRESCTLLGDLIRLQSRAGGIITDQRQRWYRDSVGNAPVGDPFTPMQEQVSALAPPDSESIINSIRDEGYQPDTNAGWLTTIKIVPLHKQGGLQ